MKKRKAKKRIWLAKTGGENRGVDVGKHGLSPKQNHRKATGPQGWEKKGALGRGGGG